MGGLVALDAGVLDDILKAFLSSIQLGWGQLMPTAMYWLKAFGTMEIILLGLSWGLLGGEELLGDILNAGVKMGFFILLVTELQSITNAVADSLVSLGLAIGGSQITRQQFLSPSTLVVQGQQALGPILEYINSMSGTWASPTNFAWIIGYEAIFFLTWLCFFFMSAHVIVAIILFQLICVMTLVLIPFGVFGYTAWIAEGGVAAIWGATLRLFSLAAITSIINPAMQWLSQLAVVKVETTVGPHSMMYTSTTLQGAMSLFGGALMLLLISFVGPTLIASKAGGGLVMTGHAIFGMGAALFGGVRGAIRAI
jgi:type IV secretory pathway TrbL component